MSFVPNLTILLAAIAGWLTGAVWYGVFGKLWMAALGKTKDEMCANQGTPAFYLPFVIAFAASFVMAWTLNGIMHHVGAITVRSGLISGAFIWFGFVLTTMATNNAFGRRRFALTLIDGGHWLAGLLVIGAVLGALGS